MTALENQYLKMVPRLVTQATLGVQIRPRVTERHDDSWSLSPPCSGGWQAPVWLQRPGSFCQTMLVFLFLRLVLCLKGGLA